MARFRVPFFPVGKTHCFTGSFKFCVRKSIPVTIQVRCNRSFDSIARSRWGDAPTVEDQKHNGFRDWAHCLLGSPLLCVRLRSLGFCGKFAFYVEKAVVFCDALTASRRAKLRVMRANANGKISDKVIVG